jgi:multidrug efflux pump subunit AcrA (membrane-fusion protein)
MPADGPETTTVVASSGNPLSGALRRWTASVSRKPRWWLLGLVVVCIAAWLTLRQRPTPVTVAKARMGKLNLTIAASGKVDGESGDLGFIGSGKIVEEYVREGDAIKAQQLLARINRSDAPGTDDVIHAPYDGYVVNVYRKSGEVVGPSTPVMRVARREGTYVTAYLDSEDAAWVKPGDRFLCRAGGYLARAWPLQVENIGHEAVPREDVLGSARQVRARLRVLNDDFALPLGTAVDIDGEVQISENVLQIPAPAVVRQEARALVWRVQHGRAEEVPVTLGPNNFRYVAITSGLNEGEAVVLEGKTGLKPGQRVEPQPWEEPAP